MFIRDINVPVLNYSFMPSAKFKKRLCDNIEKYGHDIYYTFDKKDLSLIRL